MLRCDTLLRGGLVVDGTGGTPVVADVAVVGEQIAAVGPDLRAEAGEVVDCTGLIVCPGFIDIHTHYDGQVTWDPYCSPSTQHGVTTLMFGNCGVGFAPCRPQDRGLLISILEGVEDIPGTALHEGMVWEWESFPEYLDALSRRHTACDILAMACHVPIRVAVMGERANSKNATPADLAKMRALVAEAVEAGAVGLSTSRTLLHRDREGTVIPGTYCDKRELTELMAGLAQGGGGIFEMVQDFADQETEFDWITKLSAAFGVKVSFGMGAGNKKMLRLLEHANTTGGASVTGQVAVKNQGTLQNLASKFHYFVGHPTYVRELAGLPLDRRVAAMRRKEVRAAVLSEQSGFGDAPFAKVQFNPSGLFILGDTPEYEQDSRTHSAEALARAAGVTTPEFLYDALVAGATMIQMGSGRSKWVRTRDTLLHPYAVAGLGDGGAHLGILSEAPCPTFMLTHWARDAKDGIPLPQAVKLQTSDHARLLGLADRGVIAPGKRADINVIDLAKLRLLKPEVVSDLPTGGMRWLQRAEGYRRTMVAGRATFVDGRPTGALPGRLVRNPLRAALRGVVARVGAGDPSSDFVDVATIRDPRSTSDTLVADADLTGGASAIARAARAHILAAERVSSTGDFLSGRVLNKVGLDSQGKPLRGKL